MNRKEKRAFTLETVQTLRLEMKGMVFQEKITKTQISLSKCDGTV